MYQKLSFINSDKSRQNSHGGFFILPPFLGTREVVSENMVFSPKRGFYTTYTTFGYKFFKGVVTQIFYFKAFIQPIQPIQPYSARDVETLYI